MYDYNTLKQLLLDGVELQYGRLMLCDVSHYQSFRGNKKWQVFCDDSKVQHVSNGKTKPGHYAMYSDVEIALNKFLELKSRIGSRVR